MSEISDGIRMDACNTRICMRYERRVIPLYVSHTAYMLYVYMLSRIYVYGIITRSIKAYTYITHIGICYDRICRYMRCMIGTVEADWNS